MCFVVTCWGKGWPLGSRLWCLLWVCHFPIGILGQVWYLIVSIPDLCNLTYIQCFVFVMKYALGSSAPSYIFHNQHKTLNNLYIYLTDYECVKTRGSIAETCSVPLNFLSSVYGYIFVKCIRFSVKLEIVHFHTIRSRERFTLHIYLSIVFFCLQWTKNQRQECYVLCQRNL